MPETIIDAELYFASTSGKHDVTLASFPADLSWVPTFPLRISCKIDATEGTESVVTIRPLV